MKLQKSPVFLADIEDCADYLMMEAGEEVARRWKAELDRTLQLIRRQPDIGRVRHDLPVPGIRTFFLKELPRYLVFYRIRKNKVELLRIRHGMLHLPRLFET